MSRLDHRPSGGAHILGWADAGLPVYGRGWDWPVAHRPWWWPVHFAFEVRDWWRTRPVLVTFWYLVRADYRHHMEQIWDRRHHKSRVMAWCKCGQPSAAHRFLWYRQHRYHPICCPRPDRVRMEMPEDAVPPPW